ncbi:MAG: uracil-DNA glycosylase [Spirochaetes bacterium]|nr:uracil-DNA glycosylase [Spirochaetota bacterium]
MEPNFIKKISYLLYCYLEGSASEKDRQYFHLYTRIKKCALCSSLVQSRNTVVTGQGPVPCEVMVIGEGPGYHEDRQGIPFVGPAGHLLSKMLASINLDRKNVYITNIIKCRPPQNRDPQDDEIKNCLPFLEEQIDLISPKIILTLGKFAIQTLIHSRQGITHLRGKEYTYHTVPVIPTFHPAALLRNDSLKKETWQDLQMFGKKYQALSTGYTFIKKRTK